MPLDSNHHWIPPSAELPGRFKGFTIVDPEHPLGRGGFGSVWEARSLDHPGVPLVIKFLFADDESGAVGLEGEMALRVYHRLIARTFNVLDLRSFEDWRPATSALVTQRYPLTLDRHLRLAARRATAPFTDNTLFPLLRDLCKALAYLHDEESIVHRDVKPSNLFLDLAPGKRPNGAAESLEGARLVLGDLGTATPIGEPCLYYLQQDPFKAPELQHPQLRIELGSSPAQDIWSMGCVLATLTSAIAQIGVEQGKFSNRGLERLNAAAELCLKTISPGERANETMGALRPSIDELSQLLRGADARDESRSPIPGNDRCRVEYLEWVVRANSTLQVQQRLLDLEAVYAALRADRTTARERKSAHDALLRRAEVGDDAGQPGDGALFGEEVIKKLAESPVLRALEERDRTADHLSGLHGGGENLAEAFSSHPFLVILGDPGCGKTTMVRWFARQLAVAMQSGRARVTVAASQVDPYAEIADREVDLGRARLPVLVRVSELAAAVDADDFDLTDHLGQVNWLGSCSLDHNGLVDAKQTPSGIREAQNRLIRAHLEAESCVVFVDGLDEFPDAASRSRIVRAVERFAEAWGIKPDNPRGAAGNQLVVTSRITGYHQAPLTAEVPHVTIEPMRRLAIERFIERWLAAAYGAQGALTQGIKESVEKLKAAVFNPANPGTAEMATNPLLISIMANIYLVHHELPPLRTELYRLTFRSLASDWRRFSGVDADRLEVVLAPVAEFMHTHCRTGLIPVQDFRDQLWKSLGRLDPRLQACEEDERNAVLDQYELAATRSTGVLTERGRGLFGFIHLTFQEYLAGLSLLVDAQGRRRHEPSVYARHVAKQFCEKLPDPRWREPLLLALGILGSGKPISGVDRASTEAEREGVLLGVLEHAPAGSLAAILPRNELLIGRGLDEMQSVPNAAIRLLTESLLNWLTRPEHAAADDPLRRHLVTILGRIQGHPDRRGAAEQALVAALQDRDRAGPVAAILVDLDWFSETLVEALGRADVEGLDDAELAWPMDRALRAAASPPLWQGPSLPSEVSGAELEALLRKNPQAYGAMQKNLQVARAAYRDQMLRKQALEDRKPVFQPGLRFREAVCDDARLAARLTRSRSWTLVVAAIYGGYPDLGAAATLREYLEISSFLQLSSQIREEEIAYNRLHFVSRFGPDDPVYRAAVYLDCGMGGKLPRTRVPPRFNPAAIIRDSLLTPALLALLARDADGEELLTVLQGHAEQGDSASRADAILGLIALGVDYDSLPADDAATSARVVRRLGQLRSAMCDSVTRALRQLAPRIDTDSTGDGDRPAGRSENGLFTALKHLAAANCDPWEWAEMFSAAASLAVAYTGCPVNAAPLLDLPVPYLARPMAEYWGQTLAARISDDLVYEFAMGLDRMANCPPDQLAASLAELPRAANLRWNGVASQWSVDPLMARPTDRDPLPVGCIDAALALRTDNLRSEFRLVLASVFLDSTSSLFVAHPELRAELLLVNRLNHLTADIVLSRAGRTAPLTVEEALQWATDEPSPVTRARTLQRLAELLRLEGRHQDRLPAIAAASLTAIDDVPSLAERCELLERSLLLASPGPERDRLEARLTRTALECSADSENDAQGSAIALIRAARNARPPKGAMLWCRAIECASRVQDMQRRAELFRLLGPAALDQNLAGAVHVGVAALPTATLQATAQSRVGAWLERLVSLAAPTWPTGSDVWTPVVLGGRILDAHRSNQESKDAYAVLWRQACEPQSRSQALAALARQGAAAGLKLTRDAAEAVDYLFREKVEFDALLPLIQDPTPTAIPIVERWLSTSSDARLKSYAALYLSEPTRRIDGTTLPGLMTLMVDPDDRTRLRACLALQGPFVVIKRNARGLTASSMGASTVTKIASELLAFRDNDESPIWRAWVLRSCLQDTLFDDPFQLAAWIDDLHRTGSPTAEMLLSNIYDMTPPCWQELAAGFRHGDERVRTAILRGLFCSLTTENKTSFEANDPIWLADGIIPNVRVAPKHPCPPIEALQRVRSAGEFATPEALDAAFRQLALRPIDLTAEDMSGDVLLAKFRELADATLWYHANYRGNLYTNGTDLWNLIGDDRDNTISDLMAWIAALLDRPIDNNVLHDPLTWLLFVVAVKAGGAPDLFADEAERIPDFEAKLCRVVERHPAAPARIAAVRLIGKLRSFSDATVKTLIGALWDESQVREVVQEIVPTLPRCDASLCVLQAHLASRSGLVAATAARILMSIGLSNRYDTDVRTDVQKILEEALKEGEATSRGVYEIIGGGTDEDDHRRIAYRGTVGRAIADALIAVAGGG